MTNKAAYAYVHEKSGHKVLVVLNLSNRPQAITVTDKTLLGSPYNVFKGAAEKLSATPWPLAPWGYAVYEYGK